MTHYSQESVPTLNSWRDSLYAELEVKWCELLRGKITQADYDSAADNINAQVAANTEEIRARGNLTTLYRVGE